MKEWDKTPEKQLSEEETEKEFIEMTVKMIQDPKKEWRHRAKKIQEMFNKYLEI